MFLTAIIDSSIFLFDLWRLVEIRCIDEHFRSPPLSLSLSLSLSVSLMAMLFRHSIATSCKGYTNLGHTSLSWHHVTGTCHCHHYQKFRYYPNLHPTVRLTPCLRQESWMCPNHYRIFTSLFLYLCFIPQQM